MRLMMTRRILSVPVAAVLLACAQSAAFAQVVIQSERGPLEIIGLRHWTYQALEDSMAHYAPGESLRSHACAAILQDKLGFPSAAVATLITGQTHAVVVTLVEPQDAPRVTRRTVAAPAQQPKWPAIRSAATVNGVFRAEGLAESLQHHHMAKELGMDSARVLLSPVIGERSASFASGLLGGIMQHDTPADLALALSTLGADGNAENRALAAAVLSNYAQSDDAWRALVAGLRDDAGLVAMVAQASLAALRSSGSRRVDWGPAKTDLVPLIAGANVWAYTELLAVLAATDIDPGLAAPLLAGNWHLVVSHARARDLRAREPAAAFLERISGIQSDDAERWQQWLEGLDGQPSP
jgi:hypothetical protein